MNITRTLPGASDALGIGASLLCVLHCLLTPVLLSLSPVFAHYLPGEERTHRTFAVVIALVGAVALVRGFRIHGRANILLLMLAGLAFICWGAYFGDSLPSHSIEVLVTSIGSALMISAHRLNHTFCRNCIRCIAHPEP